MIYLYPYIAVGCLMALGTILEVGAVVDCDEVPYENQTLAVALIAFSLVLLWLLVIFFVSYERRGE